MPGSSVLMAVDSENQELEIVQAALVRTPRLVKLLSYLVDHYFQGTTDHLTEFNIATEVFGRNPDTFIASEDAIARVETHRLRKRLKLYYESEGRQHPVQISIPLGTYVPVFLHRKEKKLSSPIPGHHEDHPSFVSSPEEVFPPIPTLSPATGTVPPELPPSPAPAFSLRFSWQTAWLAGVVLLLTALGIYALRSATVRSSAGPTSTTATGAISQALPKPSASSVGVAVPFHMIAGYSGPPQKDVEGFLWQADQYYQRGWSTHRSEAFLRGTSNPLIFQFGRNGDEDYNIPLKPGNYELHLYFMQPAETALGEDSENKAVFDVAVNGKLLLDEFDIVSDAMGRNTADERVFRDVSPDKDGQLHLHLSTVLGTPSINAIALLDGTPGKLLPIRIVTQPTTRTDHNGITWRPDNYFIGGRYLSHNLPNSDMAAEDVLSTERYGHFTYAIPVDTRDEYTVSLYFVEQFFGTQEANGGGVGSRIFRVICNGTTLLDNFDIFKEAGNFHVVKKTFFHIKPNAQGKLDLTFEPIKNYATVSAIEVLDESK